MQEIEFVLNPVHRFRAGANVVLIDDNVGGGRGKARAPGLVAGVHHHARGGEVDHHLRLVCEGPFSLVGLEGRVFDEASQVAGGGGLNHCKRI